MKTYGWSELIKILGVPKPTINQWYLRGFIKPLNKPRGAGHYNEYPEDEVINLLIMDALRKGGFTLPAARELAENKKGKIKLAKGIKLYINRDKYEVEDD